MSIAPEIEISDHEIYLLFEQIFQKYSIDYREYNIKHLRRRIIHRINLSGYKSFSAFQDELLSTSSFFNHFFQDLSINVTGMFRKSDFFIRLREKVFPKLALLPEIKIWVAGCSTGEEVYSLGILLNEENLLSKSKIIATDYNEKLLEIASRGEYPLSKMEEFREKYEACGKKSFGDYFALDSTKMKISFEIARKVIFAGHDLVNDPYFSGIDLLLCRNVMIYFNSKLQSKVVDGFFNSLNNNAFLCLGQQEDIFYTNSEIKFSLIDSDVKIFRKRSL